MTADRLTILSGRYKKDLAMEFREESGSDEPWVASMLVSETKTAGGYRSPMISEDGRILVFTKMRINEDGSSVPWLYIATREDSA